MEVFFTKDALHIKIKTLLSFFRSFSNDHETEGASKIDFLNAFLHQFSPTASMTPRLCVEDSLGSAAHFAKRIKDRCLQLKSQMPHGGRNFTTVPIPSVQWFHHCRVLTVPPGINMSYSSSMNLSNQSFMVQISSPSDLMIRLKPWMAGNVCVSALRSATARLVSDHPRSQVTGARIGDESRHIASKAPQRWSSWPPSWRRAGEKVSQKLFCQENHHAMG